MPIIQHVLALSMLLEPTPLGPTPAESTPPPTADVEAAEVEPLPAPDAAPESEALPEASEAEPVAPPVAAPMPAYQPESREALDERDRRHLMRNRYKAVLISGAVILGVSYMASVSLGLDTTEGADGRKRLTHSKPFRRRMAIPLAGPFAAIPEGSSTAYQAVAGVAGVSQLIGLSLVIVGAVKIPQYSDPKKRSVAFHMLPTREGAHMGMSMRF